MIIGEQNQLAHAWRAAVVQQGRKRDFWSSVIAACFAKTLAPITAGSGQDQEMELSLI